MDEEKRYEKCQPLPQLEANVFSRMLFCWLLPFLRQGRKQQLTSEDLYRIPPADESHLLGEELERQWQLELMRSRTENYKASLIKCIFRIYKKYFFLSAFLCFTSECLFKILQTIFMAFLIRHFSTLDEKEDDMKNGVLFGIGMILSNLTFTVLHHTDRFLVAHIGMKLRVGLCSLAHRKMLRLDKNAMSETSVGQMINLLSNDVNKIEAIPIMLNFIWVSPLQVIITISLLWILLGYYCFVGLGITIIFFPVQAQFGKIFSKLRSETAIKTDKRVGYMSEIINGINIIKMYAWEIPFVGLINQAREEEMAVIKKRSIFKSVNVTLSSFTIKAVLFTTFMLYVYIGKTPVTSQTIFTTVSLYNIINSNLTMLFPFAVASTSEGLISLGRIKEFLELKDKPISKHIQHFINDAKQTVTVALKDVVSEWPSSGFTLEGLNLSAMRGQLICVVGSIGSGKSSLHETLLGEMPIKSGSITMYGDIAYVSQEPWIFNASLRQNILFGKPLVRSRYKKVLKVAALDKDIESFPEGDMTIVGDRGASLSGGQKARVTLARALYRNADIYLLDDPLSAVDTHVGRHIFSKCIKGFLKKKTVILATHQLQYVKEADRVVVLNQGSIDKIYDDPSTIDEKLLLSWDVQDNVSEEYIEPDEVKSRRESRISELSVSSSMEGSFSKEPGTFKKPTEFSQSGGVRYSIYWQYIHSGYGLLVFLMMGITLTSQTIYVCSDIWLSYWTEIQMGNFLLGEGFTKDLSSIVYGSLLGGIIIASLLDNIFFFFNCTKSSVNLHDQMLTNIVRCPMRFFDTNPSGVILNRFSKDIGIMDDLVPQTFRDTITIGLASVGVVAIIIFTNPWFAIPSFILLVIFYGLRNYYLSTARQVKRLEGINRSPVFSHVTSSLQGMATIRAVNAQSITLAEFDKHQDLHSSAWYMFLCTTRWIGITMDLLITSYLSVIISTLLLTANSVIGSQAGLAISSIVSLGTIFQFGVRQSAELENQMTSVERVLDYKNLQLEADLDSHPDKKPPPSWPSSGQIHYENVSLIYDMSKPPVLKNLSFKVGGNEKVGIVGRTGAGKSSLITTLFRLTEPSGKILIDGVDITQIGLHDLRSKISIIPQDPVLFTGKLRMNLDPFDYYTDEELWRVLEDVQLKEKVSDLPGGLEHVVQEGGANFSVGQRQLVCLARALLKNNKILVMDEATANVDRLTDEIIQRTVRIKFKDCTVLTVAHRLDTIIDCQRVMVMSTGNILEYDVPHLLLLNEEGSFHQLVSETGESLSKSLLTLAESSYENMGLDVDLGDYKVKSEESSTVF